MPDSPIAPPWQYALYRPAMSLASLLYPALKKRRQPDIPYPERFTALTGTMPEALVAAAAAAPRGTVWVHGVSVGEALGAEPLIRLWQAEGPIEVPLFFSTTTNGGYRLAHKAFPPETPITFFPFDAPGPIARTFTALRPRVLVLYETELWPTLIREAKQRQVALFLANARISDRTARPPKPAHSLIAWMLQQFDAILPQSDLDARRLQTFGVREEQLLPVGNVKFDAAGTPPTPAAREAGRALLGIPPEAPVFIAGSTHPGEEPLVLEAVAQVRLAKAGLWWILAPRHLERLPEVQALLSAQGVAYRTLSSLRESGPQRGDPPTILVDTLGDLVGLYGLADCAFVGGSLIPRGGHNLLEPAAQGCPVLHGPSMENFRAITQQLTYAQAAQLVSAESLPYHIREIVGDAYSREKWRERMAQVVAEGRGTSRRIFDWVRARTD